MATVLIVNLIVFFVGMFGAYFYVNNKIGEQYSALYDVCKANEAQISPAPSEAEQCQSKGGCYANFCTLADVPPKPKISLMELINLGKMIVTKTLPKDPVCKDYCLLPVSP